MDGRTLDSAQRRATLRRIRWVLGGFVAALVLSGLTAFPIVHETAILLRWLGIDPSAPPETYEGLRAFLAAVGQGTREAAERWPFLAYGTDWLAFGHLVVAVAFLGPLRDPVKNVWVVDFGRIACLGVLPVALIAGPIREIPFAWRLIDCSFGVFGLVPLTIARRWIRDLERRDAQGGGAEGPRPASPIAQSGVRVPEPSDAALRR